jgi:hypothetical protein
LHGGIEARVVEDLRLFTGPDDAVPQHPFVAVPQPGALVAFAFRQQTQAHRVVQQLKNELRRGGCATQSCSQSTP